MKELTLFKFLVKKFPFLFATVLFMMLSQFLFDLASIFSIAPVVDLLMNPDLEPSSEISRKFISFIEWLHLPVALSTFLGVFLAFQIAKNLFFIFSNYMTVKIKYAVMNDMLLDAFRDFFDARWVFFSSTGQGVMLNTFTREIGLVGDAFFKMTMFFTGLLNFLIFLAVPFYVSWKAALAALVLGLVFAYPLYLLGPLNYRLGLKNTTTANHLNSVIHESLGLAKIILGFGLQKKSASYLEEAFDHHREATVKSQTLGLATPLIYEPFGIFAVFVTILAARHFEVPATEIVVMVWAYIKAIPLIGHMVANKNAMLNFFPSYEQIMKLRSKAKELRQESGTRTFTGFKNEIVFDHVSFSYPGQSEVLTNVTLRIPKGKMVAIVGESGSGKSTLIDMILGFNMPDKGRATIDGIPLQEFNIESFRKRLGYVPQESILFNMSIRDNLLWAKDDTNEEEIWTALRQANAEEFIRQFPKQLDTIVGDRGVRLSGGQCQRVALARAILRKPDVLILDEATSSLDTNSERLIQQAIDNIAKETTIVVIAHRLSTIVHADHIYILHKGEIVEEGDYQQLNNKKGLFYKMAQMQALEKTLQESN